MTDLVLAITPIIAQAADAAKAEQAPGWAQFVPFIFIIAIFYFVLIRPQMKAKKEQDKLISTTKTGDKIITNGGILGTVANVKDKTLIIKIADNVKIEVLKTHIATVTKSDSATSES